MGPGFRPEFGCGATPRPERLAGQRLRRRPDKCDAGRRPSGRRIPRPAASGRTRSLSLVLFPPKPLRWVSAGALLGKVIKTPVLHFFGASMWGGGITTLGVRFMLSKRWTPAGHGGLFAVFMPPQCSPCVGRISTAGTHATPTPNRAHSGSHAETRRVLRVDGDDVLGSGIIDTIDPFQADQTVAVALAEGHRNTVSP